MVGALTVNFFFFFRKKKVSAIPFELATSNIAITITDGPYDLQKQTKINNNDF